MSIISLNSYLYSLCKYLVALSRYLCTLTLGPLQVLSRHFVCTGHRMSLRCNSTDSGSKQSANKQSQFPYNCFRTAVPQPKQFVGKTTVFETCVSTRTDVPTSFAIADQFLINSRRREENFKIAFLITWIFELSDQTHWKYYNILIVPDILYKKKTILLWVSTTDKLEMAFKECITLFIFLFLKGKY